jgi:uncharacterized protein
LRFVRITAKIGSSGRSVDGGESSMTWQFVLTGLLVGGLVGATGMGGGSLMTPILVLVLGFSPVTAIGTDILHGAIFKSVGALRHRKLGTVSGQLSGWMFLGSAPMSLVGVLVATRVVGAASSPKGTAAWVLGGAFLLGGTGLLVKNLVGSRAVVRDPFVLTRRDKIAAVLIGTFGGFVVGLTSVGSGVFFGLTLLIAFPLGASKVVGTDLLHAAGLLWVAGIGHLVAGNVDLHAVLWLLIGSVPGVLLGSELSVRANDATLRVALAAVLVVSGVKLVVPDAMFWYVAVGACAFVGGSALAARRLRRQVRADVVPA